MDASRLTAWTRRRVGAAAAVAVVSLHALVGGDSASARKKRCGPCTRKKKGKCKADPRQDRQLCGVGRVCAAGRCGSFDASCPVGANRCGGAEIACGPEDAGCICFQRLGGGAVCADTMACADPACTAESGCLTGSTCIVATGAGCNCATGTACAVLCGGLG